jgi:hypothetical protein
MIFKGTVIKKLFARGSKSEHEAVCLVTDQGEYVMRRQGGNPFSDPELDKLVGKWIHCEGEVVGYTLLLTACAETEADKKQP